MNLKILLLQEKSENVANVQESLPDCTVYTCDHVETALKMMAEQEFNLVISAVHLEYDGSVFDFLKSVKTNPNWRHIPFVFYCSKSSMFARSVRHGLQIAAQALGAEKYITMETFDRDRLRAEILEVLLWPAEEEENHSLPPRTEQLALGQEAAPDILH